jgi:hypothetical protein
MFKYFNLRSLKGQWDENECENVIVCLLGITYKHVTLIKFSSYIRKFRMEQLQSHIWLTASSYIGKYLRISSYIMKPFLIYDFATAPLWISLYMRENLIIFLISVLNTLRWTECRILFKKSSESWLKEKWASDTLGPLRLGISKLQYNAKRVLIFDNLLLSPTEGI